MILANSIFNQFGFSILKQYLKVSNFPGLKIKTNIRSTLHAVRSTLHLEPAQEYSARFYLSRQLKLYQRNLFLVLYRDIRTGGARGAKSASRAMLYRGSYPTIPLIVLGVALMNRGTSI